MSDLYGNGILYDKDIEDYSVTYIPGIGGDTKRRLAVDNYSKVGDLVNLFYGQMKYHNKNYEDMQEIWDRLAEKGEWRLSDDNMELSLQWLFYFTNKRIVNESGVDPNYLKQNVSKVNGLGPKGEALLLQFYGIYKIDHIVEIFKRQLKEGLEEKEIRELYYMRMLVLYDERYLSAPLRQEDSSGTDARSQFLKTIGCAICMNVTTVDILVLACKHTICNTCYYDLIYTQWTKPDIKKEELERFKCPTGRCVMMTAPQPMIVPFSTE